MEGDRRHGLRGEPFADDSADAVLAMHMLYHVSDIGATIKELARVLRPGGVPRRRTVRGGGRAAGSAGASVRQWAPVGASGRQRAGPGGVPGPVGRARREWAHGPPARRTPSDCSRVRLVSGHEIPSDRSDRAGFCFVRACSRLRASAVGLRERYPAVRGGGSGVVRSAGAVPGPPLDDGPTAAGGRALRETGWTARQPGGGGAPLMVIGIGPRPCVARQVGLAPSPESPASLPCLWSALRATLTPAPAAIGALAPNARLCPHSSGISTLCLISGYSLHSRWPRYRVIGAGRRASRVVASPAELFHRQGSCGFARSPPAR
ncbi:class I SAM-dependent methyltransferase [Streptomyces novaecaesareae]|uniref:class I SAM-dependent methyltransferase n=1 Tax=Streptomyces novaecaesareae TaxID=68244 RepID=UPI003CC918FD